METMLADFEKAIEIEKQNQNTPQGNNQQFNKPHLVDFRKLFLAVCGLVMDSLRPIVNELIIVSDNVSKDEDKYILDFVNSKDAQYVLFTQIENLQNIIRDNGGNVFMGKATLNKYTSEQAPNHRNDNIDEIIKELHLEEFVSEFIGLTKEEINKKLYISTKDCLENLNIPSISPIIRAQYFKYKPIPVLVRFALANFLAKQKDKIYSDRANDIVELFRVFGTSQSPALDYSDKNKRDSFSLDHYPVKVAFDFAWEQCARSKYADKPVDFPKEKCESFLRTFFEYDSNEYNKKAFSIYARLLKINECLATLEHFEKEPPQDIKTIRQNYEVHIQEVDELIQIEKKDLRSINEWLDEYERRWESAQKSGDYKDLKKWIESQGKPNTNFTNAKMHLGQKRGGQKSLVLKSKSYFHSSDDKTKGQNELIKSNVTEVFKNIASTFGKKFASIRDYFNEESEVNKIKYGAVIIEDNKGDKYLLLQEKTEGGIDMPIFNTSCEHGDCHLYQVKSLTYKTVTKIYETPKRYPNFFKTKDNKTIKKENRPFWFNNEQQKEVFKERKLASLKQCLTESDFVIDPNENYLKRFAWTDEINSCTNFEELAKLVDQKGYYLKCNNICKEQITNLVRNQNCLLLPIVNQDITAEHKNAKNQFSKDWNKIFDEAEKDYRLHPEFSMFYRYPTADYPHPGEKRYSRFQINGNFLMEVIPYTDEYVSKKEQLASFNNPNKKDKQGNVIENSQESKVEQFNKDINTNQPTYLIGIDRGINELATLCVIDSNGRIIGLDAQGTVKDEFDIYVKHFDPINKCWIHNLKPQTDGKPRTILDLSNLRVETTIDGQQVLVDLSCNENGELVNTKQIVHLKHLYYLRCLAYLLQSSDYKTVVLNNLKGCETMSDEEICDIFKKKKFVDSYKGGVQYTDLPYQGIRTLISSYFEIENSNTTEVEKKAEINKLCQLDATEPLKKGVVANMIGVVVYILKKLNYDARISLENLCRAYGFSQDGLSGYVIESTNVNPDLDFKDQENAKLAGLGTYSYFEIQLLKKLFKLQFEDDYVITNNINIVPAFRSVDNYEKTFLLPKSTNKIHQFGIVYFVDPANTSRSCPICGAVGKGNVERKKHLKNYDEDELVCKKCGFHSNLSHINTDNKVMEDAEIKGYYDNHNFKAIVSGDANAGYNIAFRLGKNIIPVMGKEIQKLHNQGKKYSIDNKRN